MAELTGGTPRSRMTQNGPAAQIAAANTRGKGSFRISRAMTRRPRAALKRRDIVFLLSIQSPHHFHRGADEVSRLATDHGWLNASGQLTAAGNQLARALLQQGGTRTIFRVW